MLPFLLEIKDVNDDVQATISRGWTFFMSKITIKGSDGSIVGTINQKFKVFKPTFIITNSSGNLAATITGDWKAWNFVIKNPADVQIGAINKKWAGAVQEIFTSADKYNVTIDPNYSDTPNKIAIISAAISIDMILKERK